MIKIRYILLFTLLSSCVFGLFQVKFKVQQLDNEAKELRKELAHEKDTVHVLKAEWAYLNNPTRLASLSKKFLDLNKVAPDQISPVKPGSIITVAEKKENLALNVENKNFVKVSYKPVYKKSVKWNYKERPVLKTKVKR